ncbi:MAG: type II toxin-antitoxin system RelE/ParE family toxin [Rickettsiales bacterium]|nr:type II toxin-antitoxin system RelE/ParE family toxin [Rickettsiales bacterium]
MRKHHIIINSLAYRKLEEILLHISLESPKNALEIIEEIEKSIMSLKLLPESFPTIPEKINYKKYQVRHLFCKKSFRIIYTIRGNEVRILDIRHAAQDRILTGDLLN